MIRRIFVLSLCVQLSACAAMDTFNETFSAVDDFFQGGEDNSDPPSPLLEIIPEINTSVLWKESVGVGADEQTLKLIPAVDAEKLFVADRQGLVEAHDLKSGHLLWAQETALRIASGPGAGAHDIVLGTSDAEVIALHKDTGEILWKTSLSSEILAVPVISQGYVVLRATDGSIIALDEKTGTKRWMYEHTVPALSLRGVGAPVIVGENVIIGDENGKLLSLRLNDGKMLWETGVVLPKGRSEIERLVDLDTDPVEAGGVVYTASYRSGIAAVSAIDGEVLWRNENLSSFSGLNHDWRNLYLSDDKSHLWQIDQRTGAPLWQQKTLHGRRLTAPAIYQHFVVVGDFEGYVHWFSIDDGRELARVQITESPIDAKPVIENDIIYVYSKDGTLAALIAH